MSQKFWNNLVREPVWKRVLHELYSSGPKGSYYSEGNIGSWSENHTLAKKLNISGHDLGASLSFLDEQGLIDGYLRKNSIMKLTKDGFIVAMQNEKIIGERNNNFVMLGFTIVLALATTWQVFRIAFPDALGDISFGLGIGALISILSIFLIFGNRI